MNGIIAMLWDVWLVEWRRCMREHPTKDCVRLNTLWWEIWWMERFLDEPGPFPTPFDDGGATRIVAPMFHPSDLSTDALAQRMEVQQLLLTQLVAASLDRVWPQPNSVVAGLHDDEVRRDVAKSFGTRLELALQAVRSELENT